MSSSFDFDQLQSFSAGTIGPPGQRVFFLQAASTGEIVSLRLEKQLVTRVAVDGELPGTEPPPPIAKRDESSTFDRSGQNESSAWIPVVRPKGGKP